MGLLLLPRLFGFVFRPISMLMRGDFRGLFSLLLGVAVLVALWETALFGISTQATATNIMTEAGVAIVNPILEGSSLGLAQGPAFQALEAGAAANPTQAVSIPGLKVTILGSDIAGKTFADASRAVYAKVADAYYTGGASAVFDTTSVPASLVQNIVSALAPAGLLGWVGYIGLAPTALTAAGHAQAQMLMLWLWLASAVLGLLVFALNKGWTRLYALAHGLFTGAVPGLVVIGAAWLAASRVPNVFGSFTPLFSLIGGAVVPVYAGAGVAAVALVAAGLIGSAATKGAKAATSSARRAPAPVAARVDRSGQLGYPAYDAPAYRPAANRGAPQSPSSYGHNPSSGQPPAYGGQMPSFGQTPSYGQPPSYGQGGYDQNSSYGGSSGQGYNQGYSQGYGQGNDQGYDQGQAQPWQPGSSDALWSGDTAAYPPQGGYGRQNEPPATPDYPQYRR